MSQPIELPVSSIKCDYSFNCRGHVSYLDCADLIPSLQKHELLSPLIVVPINDPLYDYQLIAGFRRYTAIKHLNWEKVQCIVREIDLQEMRIINLEENIRRKDLNILQEAIGMRHVLESGVPQKLLAEKLRVSTTWISVRQKLLEMPEEIQQAAAAGVLTQDDILKLHKYPTRYDRIAGVKALNKIKEERKKLSRIVISESTIYSSMRYRTRREISDMIELILKQVGEGFYTKVLSWAAGYTSDAQIHLAIKELNPDYQVPKEYL